MNSCDFGCATAYRENQKWEQFVVENFINKYFQLKIYIIEIVLSTPPSTDRSTIVDVFLYYNQIVKWIYQRLLDFHSSFINGM